MLVAVVGGNLQGVEAAYLAHKAEWEVRVIDKNDRAPASGLCDSFVHADLTVESEFSNALKDVDLIVPALEDDDVLTILTRWSRKTGVPFAFDPKSYATSSSKLKSNSLFKQLELPVPVPWPECGVPVLAKPSRGSGSKGVKVFHDFDSLINYFSRVLPPPGWVLQEYLDGSLHSLEIMGEPGCYRALQVTDLYMDQSFDCKRVVAPTELASDLIADFEELSLTIADAIKLHGIMDVEVVLNQGDFKVLEIDARLPSQTPTTVYWSTGQNLVQMLGEQLLVNIKETQSGTKADRGIVYEHIRMSPEILETRGEHIMTEGGPLYLLQDFFGADEAITNFNSRKNRWVATLIISGTDRCSALAKRERIIEEIVKRLSIKKIYDTLP